MKTRFTLLAMMIMAVSILTAQVTDAEAALREQKEDLPDGWTKGGLGVFTFSQASLTNWAAGGENSISGNIIVNLFANYKKESLIWQNSLEVGYGMLRKGSNELIKSDDKIDLTSLVGYKAFKDWYYAGYFNFRTQMTPGYEDAAERENKISDFLAPAYIMLALGLNYKPNDNFSAYIAPIGAKFTIVNDQALADAGAFGVDPGQKTRAEFGGYVRVAYQTALNDIIDFNTNANFFSNYLENPQNIDINWELMLLIKAAKFLTVTFSTHLIYDDDIMINIGTNSAGEDMFGPRTQFKQLLGIGMSYSF